MWPDAAEDVRCRVTRLFRDMKFPAQAHFMPTRPILAESGETLGHLRPIPAHPAGFAHRDAELMATWRNQARESFFTWVDSSEEGVKRWLQSHYGSEEDALLLMLEGVDRVPFGHFGIRRFDHAAGTCEFGQLLRGRRMGPAEGMLQGAKSLFRWVRHGLAVKRILSEVFTDNPASLQWCIRMDAHFTTERPLYRLEQDGIVRWVSDPSQPGAEASDRASVGVEWDLASLDFCR